MTIVIKRLNEYWLQASIKERPDIRSEIGGTIPEAVGMLVYHNRELFNIPVVQEPSPS